jgi:hypothetical protein
MKRLFHLMAALCSSLPGADAGQHDRRRPDVTGVVRPRTNPAPTRTNEE